MRNRFIHDFLKVLAFVGHRRPWCLTTSVLLRWTDASSQCMTLATNGAPGLLAQEPQQRTMRSRSSKNRSAGVATGRSTRSSHFCSACTGKDAAASCLSGQQCTACDTESAPREWLSACERFSLARLGEMLCSVQEITDRLVHRLDAAQLPAQTVAMRVGMSEAQPPPQAERMSEFARVYALAGSQ